jgi:hypothetical protein
VGFANLRRSTRRGAGFTPKNAIEDPYCAHAARQAATQVEVLYSHLIRIQHACVETARMHTRLHIGQVVDVLVQGDSKRVPASDDIRCGEHLMRRTLIFL